MYRSNPFCSTKTPGLNMWKHLWTRKRENPKTRKGEEWKCGRENGENAKTAKTRKPRKRGKRENAKTAKTRKRRKRRKPENGQKCSCFLVFLGFLGFLVFSVFWFSRFLVFSFRWPHPSGQVAFFMCLADRQMLYFTIQNWRQDRRGKVLRSGGCEMTILCSDVLGLSSNRLSIGGSNSRIRMSRWNADLRISWHAGRTIRWGWRVTWLAPRIGNDVSYVTRINHDIHFAWQAQYLVKLEGDFSWQAQHVVTLWEIAGARNVVFFNTKSSPRSDREGPKRRVRDDDFILGLSSDYPRIVFLLAEAFQGVSAEVLSLKTSRQAQYLVSLKGDFTCSAHWKWRFICDADQSWHLFCVAGRSIWWGLEGDLACSANWKWPFICDAD